MPMAWCTPIVSTFSPGLDLGLGRTIGGPGGTQIEIAVGFVPSFSGEVDSVKVAGFHATGPNDYLLWLASDNSGQPGSAIETFSGLSLSESGGEILTINSSLRPLLSMGSTYWVVMSAANLGSTWGGWTLNDQSILGIASRSALTNYIWTDEPGSASPAFEVNATAEVVGPAAIPEPATLGLMFAGLAALSVAARFRLRFNPLSKRVANRE